MADYEVPQFIGRENKLLGPLTVRQTLIVAGFVIVLITLYFGVGQSNMTLFILIALFLGVVCGAIVFLPYNGRPISVFLFSLLGSVFAPTTYKWRRTQKDTMGKAQVATQKPDLHLTKYNVQKLAQFLDTPDQL
ncbi:MAG: PrgI family protein [Candidatus Spechtbacteria bacterium SB0662_bin_43]|uniref:PrgI family protein n=1 Tax=Candidatus Spechtbacteria bacterium SB0662_bin_43 TaxID=2604897 RepID=A0A845DBD7_9BACT|nr:PrgI family protein [Candidatus Spechtbacteria bacterium SB0662_bin_43]